MDVDYTTVMKALELLGLNNSYELPTLERVRKAFFEIAKKNHPDKNQKSDKDTKQAREENFKIILNAYKLVAEYIIEWEKTNFNEEDLEDIDDDEDIWRDW